MAMENFLMVAALVAAFAFGAPAQGAEVSGIARRAATMAIGQNNSTSGITVAVGLFLPAAN
jgi:hypothetical protein